MLNETIQVSSSAMRRLSAMTAQMRKLNMVKLDVLEQLEDELGRSAELAPAEVPREVVTMHSKLTLEDLTSGKAITCTLAFPRDADASRNQVSMRAASGMPILDYHVGDRISWQMTHGQRQLNIQTIHYQPEAAGDYHL